MENKAYLLLLMADYCRDADEWLGVYTDVEKLKRDYVKACADLDERCKKEGRCGLKVKIYAFPSNFYGGMDVFGVAREVSIAELEAEEKNTDCELLARLTALSEAWKNLKERTEGKRPGVPLVWTVDEDGLLYLDGKWVCPVKYVGVDRLAKRELSSLVSDVTIVLTLTEGNMDLIILKEFEEYEFDIVERMV